MWLLSLATFVNRAGTMVIPFIALYLAEDLSFSLTQVGWVMTSFGFGSTIGSWAGGKLSDKFSFYQVMVVSLLLTGICFIFLFQFKSFSNVCFAIFILMIIADSFRPASFAAISAYSKQENRVRSISLIRLAINLGFSMGPAVGGFLIYNYGYEWLFYIDGVTCISASMLIILLLAPKKRAKRNPEKKVENVSSTKSVWTDRPYLLLIFIVFLIDIIFIQVFANVPLFYREVHLLGENTIGWLLAMNGILILIFEMPLVSYLEHRKINKLGILAFSCVLIAASYFSLNFGVFFIILLINMVLITFGEMLGFPFSNSFAIDRAPGNRVGEYMGLYTVAFSASHIIGPNIGLRISDHYGFETSWYVMGVIGIIAAVLCVVLKRWMDRAERTEGSRQ
jgi:predicted MFS family arabinose efflux permease